MATADQITIDINAKLVARYDLLKKAFLIVSGLLVVALVAILILWLSLRNERAQSAQFESRLTQLQKNDERLTAKIGRMESKIASDSITASRTIAHIKTTVTGTRSIKTQLRPRIARDSATVAFAALGDLEELQMDTLVATQSEAFQAQVKDLRTVIALERAKNSNKDSLLIAQNQTIKGLQRDVRKQRNSKNFWKSVFLISFMAAAYIASQ